MYGDTCSVWTMVALTHVSHVAVVFLLLLSVAAYRRMHRCIGGLVSPTRRPKLTGLCPVAGASFHAALSGSFLSVMACTDPIVSVLLSTLRGFRLVLRNAILCEDKRRVVWPHEIVV